MTMLNLELLNDLPALVQALVKKVEALMAEVRGLREALPPSLVSVKTAAERLELSESTVRRMVDAKQLRSMKVGGSVRIDLRGVVAKNADEIATMVSEKKKL
jgi:excisionase family DNA binding protein